MRKIVCLSTSPFDPIPTRKQQVMTRLQDAEILYFDPPVSYLAPLKDPAARPQLSAWKQQGRRVRDNITVYSLPPVLPLFNRFRVINRWNQRWQARFIRKKMRQHGFDRPMLWCYSPTACDITAHLPHSSLIYDCVDRHSAYQGQINPQVVDQMERELAGQVDQVFCTAEGLYQTLVQYNAQTVMIPNGGNVALFSTVHTEREQLLKKPNELDDCSGPILGFVGALQECIDYPLIERAAREQPDWTIVLIGAPKPGADLEGLKQCKNVRFLGLKPYQQLPEYMARFSACLNVFRSGDLARDVSPLKFYEYLATGLPIVSTPQPLQVREYAGGIYLAERAEDFVPACRRAIAEQDPQKVEQRLTWGRETSWDSRVAQMERILAQRGLG